MKSIRSLNSLKEKTALVRIDLNIEPGEEKNAFRVGAVVPTIRFLRKKGARVVLISHRGKTQQKNNQYSLNVFAPLLTRAIGEKVQFVVSNIVSAKWVIAQNKANIFLLENLRFFESEEDNDVGFARVLSRLGDVYVNDAFAVSHRKNASVVAITKQMPSYAGLLLESEIKNLSSVMDSPKRPFTLIVGGAKIVDKVGVIEKLWRKVDYILLGGGPANTAMLAQGLQIGDSIADKHYVPFLRKFMKTGKIYTPASVVINRKKILDITPLAVSEYAEIIKKSKTVVWNGPMGLFEDERYIKGSAELAKAIVKSKAFSVVGGGETTALITKLKLIKKFSFVSTGGGAMLEFLSGKKLPGIACLDETPKKE